ncbi:MULTISPECIES: helix-turn-helix domain-containing protein [Nocardiopsis]|uniref:helix-turn-helix domain-containing protein n=1 Tax=Nocardiopsis TaxID=2013 RepID=UPI001F29FC95|nr:MULTISPECIES: helix-turn-helix domain-containing protein [Nocardiopsis]
MLTGFRYRLAPTGEQAGLCQVYGDICRAVWNTGLHQRREAVRRWQRGQDLPFCGYHLQARQLAEAKTEEEWLKTAPSHILQQVLRDLDARVGTTARSVSVGVPRAGGSPPSASPTVGA